MLNQIVIVGRLVNNPEKAEDGSVIIKVAVPRSYKNAEGEYDTDFITAKLWEGIAEKTTEFCSKGDLVGVKGRVESKDDNMIIVAEKITFLTSGKKEEE